MSMLNVYNEIKKVHPDFVLLIKSGTFYEILENDAYVLSNISGYKIVDKTNYQLCGFPSNVLAKVTNKLEQKSINYIVLDSRDNYDELERCDYEKLNKYEHYLEKGKREVKRKNIIQEYNQYLEQNIERKFMDKLLKDIGKLIDKTREI